MARQISLIIVEDNRLLREGLTAMLEEQPDMAVIASLSNGDGLVRGKRFHADVVLLDSFLAKSTSLGLVQSLREKDPGTRIVVMNLTTVQPSLVEFVQGGVSGFILQDATFDEFLQTIRDVAQGKKILPSPLTTSLFSDIADHIAKRARGNPFRSVRMTNRERQVIDLIAEGRSNKQIAARLNLAVDTVKSHVHTILDKLSLHTRLEIATYRHTGGRPPFPKENGSAPED